MVPELVSCFREFTKGPRIWCKFVLNYLTHMFLFSSVRDPDYESESERSVPGMRLRMNSTCMCVCAGRRALYRKLLGRLYTMCAYLK